MLLIGSMAMRYHGVDPQRLTQDIDFICTQEEYKAYSVSLPNAKVILDEPTKRVLDTGSIKIEFDIAQKGDSNDHLLQLYGREGITYAPLDLLWVLKMSHRYKKNSPHFIKTMRDIQLLSPYVEDIDKEIWLEGAWYKLREEETYNYNHPNLKVSKDEFFDGDDIPYKYDHDSIHDAVCILDKPAYTYYKPDENEVFCSKELFYKSEDYIKLLGVYEESCVLALERSLIPYNFTGDADKVFRYALMKVCTSITSGWFREWAYNNYDRVIDLHEKLGVESYVNRFQSGLNHGKVTPFSGKKY